MSRCRRGSSPSRAAARHCRCRSSDLSESSVITSPRAVHVHLHLLLRACVSGRTSAAAVRMAGTLRARIERLGSPFVAAVRRLVDRPDCCRSPPKPSLRELLNLHSADRRHREEDDEEREHEGDHVGVRQQPSHHAGRLELLLLLRLRTSIRPREPRVFTGCAIVPFGYAPRPENRARPRPCRPLRPRFRGRSDRGTRAASPRADAGCRRLGSRGCPRS